MVHSIVALKKEKKALKGQLIRLVSVLYIYMYKPIISVLK